MKNSDISRQGHSSDSTKSLNEQNWPGLLAITTLNFAAFAVVAGILTRGSGLPPLWPLLLPAGVGLAMTRVINGLLDSKTKDRLVFWKWRHPQPGCEAFSVYAKGDERYEPEHARALVENASGLNPILQNRHWYNMVYWPVQNAPSVMQVNRNFLFTRDYTGISAVMTLALGGAGYFLIKTTAMWAWYVVGLVLQYLLVSRAARNYGIETVTNAFAARLATIRNPSFPVSSSSPASE